MNDKDTRIPAPLVAVAGAGDYALRQLRRLPAVTAELREELPQRVAIIRERLPHRVGQLRAEIPDRIARMRSGLSERRVPEAMDTLMTKGRRLYGVLVARGEQVINRTATAGGTTAPAPTVATNPPTSPTKSGTRRSRPRSVSDE